MRKKILTTLFSAALLGLAMGEKSDVPTLEILKNKRASAPVQLTASDGTGLKLVDYQAKVVVQGPLAFTELHLTFANPQDRVLEGHFEITLPEKAALSRLAMKNANGWQEAEVVELQQARRAYEDFLHRRQDPALLEKQAGNQFQARVFPIPANGQKELILSYSQEMADAEDYRLPVAGLPKVAEMSVSASVWNGPQKPPAKLQYSLHGESPKGDFTITHCPPVKGGLISGDEVALSVQANGADAPDPSQDVLLLVDTSASRAAGYGAQVAVAEGLVSRWKVEHPGGRIGVAAFDQDVVPLSSVGDLRKRRPLGATNLARALRWAAAQKGYQRLVMVSDGVTTSGPESLAGLLKGSSFQRFDAVVMGGIRDSQAMEGLAYRALPRSGFVLDGDRPLAETCRRLSQQPLSGLEVSVKGAEWVWPTRLDGLAPGESRLVYARLPRPGQSAEVTVAGRSSTLPLSSAQGPLLHRAAVAANLARLTPQWRDAKGKRKEELAHHMVELSTGNRVVCDLTGLLILETDADYQRFHIDRKALKDVLVVTPEGLELQHRSDAVVSKAPVETLKNKDEAKEDDARPPAGRRAAARPAPPSSGAAPSVARPAPAEGAMQSAVAAPAQSEASGDFDKRASETTAVDSPPPPPAPPPPPRDQERTAQAGRPPARAPLESETNPRTRSRMAQRRSSANVANPEPVREAAEGTASGEEEVDKSVPALTGSFAQIDSQLHNGHAFGALQQAARWHQKQPGDVLALVAFGNALKASGQPLEAARAYGSIIDLYPGRADLRRYAGCLLETVQEGRGLAWDSFAKAVQQRPDHPSGYRMKAYALVRVGQLWEAFQTLETAYQKDFPEGRFAGVREVLADDLGIVGQALAVSNPDAAGKVKARLHKLGVPLQDKPSLRFILTWETDANDVDFHIRDSKGGHAFYSQKELPSGGRLYADVTTGYGPECFAIPGKAQAFPYKVFIHYYSRGPMGYGMGKIEILRHDGHGRLRFEERPFVVMNDQAYVDLGTVKPD